MRLGQGQHSVSDTTSSNPVIEKCPWSVTLTLTAVGHRVVKRPQLFWGAQRLSGDFVVTSHVGCMDGLVMCVGERTQTAVLCSFSAGEDTSFPTPGLTPPRSDGESQPVRRRGWERRGGASTQA